MAVVAGDIKFYHSGGAANSDPNASLGGVQSSVEITDATLENLFDNVSSADAASGETNYRCLYVENTNGVDTLTAALTFFASVPSVTGIAMGLDPAGVNGTATTIANEDAVPGGVAFTIPETAGAGLAIGDLTAGDFQAIWVRRTVAPGAASNPLDSTTVRVQGDTV